jgi:hypothetical protein
MHIKIKKPLVLYGRGFCLSDKILLSSRFRREIKVKIYVVKFHFFVIARQR